MPEANKAKKFLCRIGSCDARINAMLAEVDGLYAMVTKITPTLKADVVTGGGSQDKIGDAVAKIVDLRNEINREIDRFVDMKREAAAMLDKLENHLFYIILHRRYVQYESLEQIAADMHYTYRWVCILHGRALQEFGDILEGIINPEEAKKAHELKLQRKAEERAKEKEAMRGKQKMIRDEYGEDSQEYQHFLNEYGDWEKDEDE
jgi:hypothetical protein